MSADGDWSLEGAGSLAGGHCWIESRLFEVTGGWVASTEEVAAKLMLDRHSRHHAWRAAQWWDRLPLLADVKREGLVAPPAPYWEEAFAALTGQPSTIERLAGTYRIVLPRLIGRYEAAASALSAVSDSSSLRALRIVGADAVADWKEGELALQGLLKCGEDATRAAGATAEIEAMLVGMAPIGPNI